MIVQEYISWHALYQQSRQIGTRGHVCTPSGSGLPISSLPSLSGNRFILQCLHDNDYKVGCLTYVEVFPFSKQQDNNLSESTDHK